MTGPVLVTGASGFIGSELVRRLSANHAKVVCLVRKTRVERAWPRALPGVAVIEVEAFQTEELRRALRGVDPEFVFNLAAYGVDPDDQDHDAMLDGNVNLVARLLLALADRPVTRFVHAGSCAEYGTPRAGERVAEDHPLLPTSLYGAAKAASVIYGNALAKRLGIPFVTLRLFGVFGVGERPRRLVPYVIERLMRDEAVDLTPGEQVRDLLYVEDVAEALVLGGRCDAVVPYTVYNVCSGQPVRVREIAETIADVMGKPRRLLEFGKRPYRGDEAMWLVGSHARFVGATDWRPTTSLWEGIRRMIAAAEETRGRRRPAPRGASGGSYVVAGEPNGRLG